MNFQSGTLHQIMRDYLVKVSRSFWDMNIVVIINWHLNYFSEFLMFCLLQKFPSGHWHCLYCSCKSCGQVSTGLHTRDDDHEADAALLCKCHLCEEKCNESNTSFACRTVATSLL